MTDKERKETILNACRDSKIALERAKASLKMLHLSISMQSIVTTIQSLSILTIFKNC